MARAVAAEQAGAATMERLQIMTARAEGAERDSLDAAILARDSKKHDSEMADARIAVMEIAMKKQKVRDPRDLAQVVVSKSLKGLINCARRWLS